MRIEQIEELIDSQSLAGLLLQIAEVCDRRCDRAVDANAAAMTAAAMTAVPEPVADWAAAAKLIAALSEQSPIVGL